MCTCFCMHMFLIFLGMYLRVELLGHTVILFLNFEKLPNSFPKMLQHFTFSLAISVELSIFNNIFKYSIKILRGNTHVDNKHVLIFSLILIMIYIKFLSKALQSCYNLSTRKQICIPEVQIIART